MEVLRLHGGQNTVYVPLAVGRDPLHIFLVGDEAQMVLEIDGGGEPLHRAGGVVVEPEDEAPGEGGDQPVQDHRQEVEQEVHRRHSEGVAGDEAHQGGAGKEEERLSQHRQHRDAQAHRVKGPGRKGREDAEDPGYGAGQQHHGKSREEAGEEQPLPPDRQGVEEPHAPGAVQVAPHRQGAQRAVDEEQHRPGVAHHAVVYAGELRRGGISRQGRDRCRPAGPSPAGPGGTGPPGRRPGPTGARSGSGFCGTGSR